MAEPDPEIISFVCIIGIQLLGALVDRLLSADLLSAEKSPCLFYITSMYSVKIISMGTMPHH